MLLVIDVDEVRTQLGVFGGGGGAAWHWWLPTAAEPARDELAAALRGLLGRQRLRPAQIRRLIVCSAAPAASIAWAEVARTDLGRPVVDAGSLPLAGMLPGYAGSGGLAAHRLAGLLAARARVDGACVIADFGAVTTYDAVSAAGEYLGGVVMPSAQAALGALRERASLLPKVALTVPASPVGTSTAGALRSGTVHGFAGQVTAIVGRLRRELGGRARVIATGAGAVDLARLAAGTVDEVDGLLTLTGLRMIAGRTRK
jgi:type III pantothenate kinase